MNDARAYSETNVKTATPMQLILMLYDAGLRSLGKAKQAFDIEGPERFEAIGNHLLHAQDVITELAVSLDMEKGGEVAANLHNLYDFLVRHLSDANIKKDPKPIDDVAKILTELRDAWRQVESQAGAGQTVQCQAPRSGIRVSG